MSLLFVFLLNNLFFERRGETKSISNIKKKQNAKYKKNRLLSYVVEVDGWDEGPFGQPENPPIDTHHVSLLYLPPDTYFLNRNYLLSPVFLIHQTNLPLLLLLVSLYLHFHALLSLSKFPFTKTLSPHLDPFSTLLTFLRRLTITRE